MTSPAGPGSQTAVRAIRPPAVGLGCALVVLAAVVNLSIAALVGVQASSTSLPVQPGFVVALVMITVLYSAALIVLAVLLVRGRVWARAALLAVSALSLLTLFAPNALNLIVTIVLVVAVLVLHNRSVSAWVRALRGRAPA